MELINTKDLYENDAFVIIEAEFEDSETKKRMQEISLGLKNNQGDITKIRTIHRKQFYRKGPGGSQTAVTGSFFYSCLHRDIFTFHPQRYAARNGKPFPAAGNPQACR